MVEIKDFVKNNREIIVFIAIIFTYLVANFHFFEVPESDFFAYFSNTNVLHDVFFLPDLALQNYFEWINFQKLPLYSLIFLPISYFLGNNSLLMLYLLSNLILYPILIFLVYRISRNYLSHKISVLVAIFFGINPITIYLTLQPLPAILFECLLLTTFLPVGNSRNYLFQFLLNVTRYEGAIASFFVSLKKSITEDPLKNFGYFIFSLIGVFAWIFGLSLYFTGKLPFGFLSKGGAFTFSFNKRFGYYFLNVTFFEVLDLDVVNLAFYLLPIFLGVGGYKILKERKGDFLPILGFFLSYIFLHFIFVKAFPRLVFFILPFIYILVFKAVLEINEKIKSFNDKKNLKIILLCTSIIILFICLEISSKITSPFIYPSVLFALLVSTLVFVLWRSEIKEPKTILYFGIILIFTLFAFHNTGEFLQNRKGQKAIFSEAGKWYSERFGQENCMENKMLLTQPYIPEFFVEFPEDCLLSTKEMDSDNLSSLRGEMKARNITYVVWTSLDNRNYYAEDVYWKMKANLVDEIKKESPEYLVRSDTIRSESERGIVYKLRANITRQ